MSEFPDGFPEAMKQRLKELERRARIESYVVYVLQFAVTCFATRLGGWPGLGLSLCCLALYNVECRR